MIGTQQAIGGGQRELLIPKVQREVEGHLVLLSNNLESLRKRLEKVSRVPAPPTCPPGEEGKQTITCELGDWLREMSLRVKAAALNVECLIEYLEV